MDGSSRKRAIQRRPSAQLPEVVAVGSAVSAVGLYRGIGAAPVADLSHSAAMDIRPVVALRGRAANPCVMQTLDHRRPGGVDPWEAAYLRFETPEQEVAKFRGRLQHIGATAWPRDWLILDLFCGRGGGGQALRRMGFEQIYGVDMSERLLREHRDRGSTAVGDCTRLPIASRIADVAIVQGG